MTLEDFFAAHPRCALGFSGGVDSSYLLAAGIRAGARIRAYYIKTAFQPEFELEDAKRIAAQLSAELRIIELDILKDTVIADNSDDRCYHCKTRIFSVINAAASADGFFLLLDGTNASDDASDRPGMKALDEMSVMSPLRMCGLTKDMIRERSHEMGLFTWNKPAYACLATRIRTGQQITSEALQKVEKAEMYLKSLGFMDIRVRTDGDTAKIQVPEAQIDLLAAQRIEIVKELKQSFQTILLDLEGR